MPAPGYPFTFPHPTFITHTLRHNTIHIDASLKSSHIRYTSFYNVARRSGANIEKGSHYPFLSAEDAHTQTHTHTFL